MQADVPGQPGRRSGTDGQAFLDAALLRDYRPVDPVGLQPVDRDALKAGPADGLYAEAGKAVRTFRRRGAAFLDDPDGVALFVPEQVGPVDYTYPPAFTAAVNDALLVGFRTILTPAGEFFTDEAYALASTFERQLERLARPDEFSNEATGLRPTGRGRGFRLERNGRELRQIEGTAVFLGSDEPLSYGSFLFRVLPKVGTMRELGLLGLPCLAYADQKPYRDLLTLAGVPDDSIVLHDLDVLTRVDRVLVPSLRSPDAYIDPESRAFLAELCEAHGDPGAKRRLYVSRFEHNLEGWSTRIMTNEAALIARLKTMGFEIVEPQQLAVRDQIGLFASAEIIVGPSGSGLFNTVFCRPGTKVIDIQSEGHWIYSYAGMYDSLQLDYGIFVGKADPEDQNPVHRRWTVNVDALAQRVGDFLGR